MPSCSCLPTPQDSEYDLLRKLLTAVCTGTGGGGGTGNVSGSGANKEVTYWTGASTISGDANLIWDYTNGRLGIGLINPAFTLDVVGIINTSVQYDMGGLFFGAQHGTNNNVSVGKSTANVNAAITNITAIGAGAGGSLTSGTSSTYIGKSAAAVMTGGTQNVMVGTSAGVVSTTSSQNTFIGYHAGFSNVTTAQNTMVGNQAGNLATGSRLTLIGNGAGYNGAIGLTTGDDNIFLGWLAGGTTVTGSSDILIGTSANANGISNSIVLGNSGTATANNQFILGSASSFISEEQHFWSGTGVHGEYFRTTTPEASQAAQRGSVAYVDDATTGELYLKQSGTGNTGWFKTSRIAGSFSQAVIFTGTFTVTIGITLSNNTYQVNVTPTAALTAALFYVNNKTTTTFDVVFNAALNGTVTFDWTVFP